MTALNVRHLTRHGALSLVDLYLHGFADPRVEEYATPTSEDKWTEMADVILAKPPFMSAKGGAKSHTRIQVQSKRSEVRFADDIAEHLTPKGRAAIVVPEGIIFQSQSAYVALHKMLVEKHIAAVISLPVCSHHSFCAASRKAATSGTRRRSRRHSTFSTKPVFARRATTGA